jgi:hypothetical protein
MYYDYCADDWCGGELYLSNAKTLLFDAPLFCTSGRHELNLGVGGEVQVECPENFSCGGWVDSFAKTHFQVEFPQDFQVPEACDSW